MRYSRKLILFIIPLFIIAICNFHEASGETQNIQAPSNIQKNLDEIQKTQKEILQKLNKLERKVSGTGTAPSARTIDSNKVYNIPIENSPIKGDKNAPVTIVEFSDFQCPYCAQLLPTLKEVLKAFPKEVKLIDKQYPLSFHAQTKNAAKASLAAKKQGKFWEMHDIIFENFIKLSPEKFVEFARQIGLDITKFTANYNSDKYEKQIQQDIALGNSVGVTGTPTLFVNGKQMARRSFDDFKEAINNELKKK